MAKQHNNEKVLYLKQKSGSFKRLKKAESPMGGFAGKKKRTESASPRQRRRSNDEDDRSQGS